MNSKYFLVLFQLLVFKINAQNTETIGLLKYENRVTDGFNLLTPLFYNKSYLIDNCGNKVHEWTLNYRPGPTYMLPNGDILTSGWDSDSKFKAGGITGFLERLDWRSSTQWSVKISDEEEALHHDFFLLENGNILAQVWERISAEEVIASGRNPKNYSDEIFSEKVVEIKPIGSNSYDIVWEWRVWDHLVQNYDATLINYGDPEVEVGRIDLNYVSDLAEGRDWIHFNSLDYNAELDLILLSARHFNELWVIDHSTTTEEAKANVGGNFNKGGNLIYRWGNPRAYIPELDEQQLFGQHDARWLRDDQGLKIIVFNNGFNSSETKSKVEIILPEFDPFSGFGISTEGTYYPENTSVLYSSNEDNFYSSITSGAQLLNGGNNLLVTLGSSGHCYEIDLTDGRVIWEYVNPVTGNGPQEQGSNVVSPDPSLSNTLFKLWRYPYAYLNDEIEFDNEKEPIELNDKYQACVVSHIDDDIISNSGLQVYLEYDLAFDELIINSNSTVHFVSYNLCDINGKILNKSNSSRVPLSEIGKGVYLLHIQLNTDFVQTIKLVRQ